MNRSISLLMLLCSCALARDTYISPTGSADAQGTPSAPYRTLRQAAAQAKAGDTIYLLGGRYTEPMTVSGLSGTPGRPITICPAPGARVVFDGTDLLPDAWQEVTPQSVEGRPIQPAQWQGPQGKLFCQTLDTPIYALIYDDRLMSAARWPNARWDDPWRLDRYMVLRRASEKSTRGRLHDGLPTDNALEESSLWIHYDRSQLRHRDEMLGDTGLCFEDAIAVMSHTWGSWATRITAHQAGSHFFAYDTSFAGSGSIQQEAIGFLNNRIGWQDAPHKFKRSSHGGIHFFFLGLPALDIPEEWWYHAPTRRLYFIAPDGRRPQAGKLRGKRRDFQLTVRESEHVHVKGFEFFGGAALLQDCTNTRLEDCTFRFGSYHKFSIGNFDMPVTTRIENRQRKQDGDRGFGNALINCEFTYLDGNAFEGRSTGLTIDNVLIYRTQQTTLGLDSRSMSIDRPLRVRRVTINDVGASVGIKGGGIDSVYELNNIMRFGGLQYDGAALQMGGRQRYIYRYNWSHDHPKRSYRFDAGSYPDYANAFGEMSYNVAWNTPGGFAVKGDDHLIHNNLLLGDTEFSLFNMKRWASKNERTLVANNIVSKLAGGLYDWDKPVLRKRTTSATPVTSDDYWLKETEVAQELIENGKRQSVVLALQKNNYMDDPLRVLRDPANLDFRPKQGSALVDGGYPIAAQDVPWKKTPLTGSETWEGRPDIGAYEYGANQYWIPGFQFAHASTPIPPDGTATAKRDYDLMWLGGYQAERHDVYFGQSNDAVARATRQSPVFCKTFDGTDNIYDPGDLERGQTYYWRVDAIRQGRVTKGPIWTFTVN